MNVYVFKTSITNQHLNQVEQIINALIPDSSKWNFDFEDCDNILRVESRQDIAEKVCAGLRQSGFSCKELE